MLKGKNAIITGSTSGIGLGVAHKLATEGCNITINGFGEKSLIDSISNEITNKYGVKVLYSNADMSKPEQIRDMVEGTIKNHGSVDILVNNAGIQHVEHTSSMPSTTASIDA